MKIPFSIRLLCVACVCQCFGPVNLLVLAWIWPLFKLPLNIAYSANAYRTHLKYIQCAGMCGRFEGQFAFTMN